MKEIYELYAKKLLEVIDERSVFFNGQLTDENTNTSLRLTIIVHRGDGDIPSITPVWWAFEPTVYNGEYFSWSEFKDAILSIINH